MLLHTNILDLPCHRTLIKLCLDSRFSQRPSKGTLFAQVSHVMNFELLSSRKFGLEVKGVNTKKGSGEKSYFLWSQSQSVVQVRSIAFLSVLPPKVQVCCAHLISLVLAGSLPEIAVCRCVSRGNHSTLQTSSCRSAHASSQFSELATACFCICLSCPRFNLKQKQKQPPIFRRSRHLRQVWQSCLPRRVHAGAEFV